MKSCVHCEITGERLRPVDGARGQYECHYTRSREARILARLAHDYACVRCGVRNRALERATDVEGMAFRCQDRGACGKRISIESAVFETNGVRYSFRRIPCQQ